MPTPPLPLFQALLDAVHIPLRPPSISSIPPSLLLITLERVLRTKLPLPPHLHQASTPDDELSIVKVILGVMADDELSMDLSAVDPVRVVMGAKDEMGVVIMALVVIAKRHGIHIHAPKETYDTSRSDGDLMDEGEDGMGLMGPLRPDITLSSPVVSPTPTMRSGDVFAATSQYGRSGLFAVNDGNRMKRVSSRDEDDLETYGQHSKGGYETPLPHRRMTSRDLKHPDGVDDPRERRDLRDAIAFEKVAHWRENASTNGTGRDQAPRGKTVLQEMMDEFGLG